MKEIANILKQIESTSSKKEKEAILASHKDNTLLKQVLNQIYNPFLKTNIAKKKLAKKVDMAGAVTLRTLDDFLGFLAQSTGRDEHIATVQAFISEQPEDLQWLYEAMAIKNLKFGFTESTINKAFEYDFIPTFEVMLAEKYKDEKINKKTGEKKVKLNYLRYKGKIVVATPKLDGNRCVVFVHDNGLIELLSRSGKLLEGYYEVEEAFRNFPRGFVYDGELLATNEEGFNSKDLFTKTQRITRSKGEKKDIHFHAFDILPIESFKSGLCNTPCIDRKNALEKVVETYSNGVVEYVKPLYVGIFDEAIINQLSEQACELEEEGIMVQLADAPYQCKRTFDILKVKVFESADLRVIGYYEGKEASTKNKLGGFVVDYRGFEVNVGGGYSKEEREEFWLNPEAMIGTIIEVKYFKESQDKHGNLSLRFPVFKTIREDKTEPSYH